MLPPQRGQFQGRRQIRSADVGGRVGRPSCFSVYSLEQIGLAKGDTIRITANGKTKDGKHKLNNGSTYTVGGFTREGDITLTNDWVIGKEFQHIAHGYVSTSYASQGKTTDRILIAMGSGSIPAINADQFYVSVSRGRQARRFTVTYPPRN